MCPLDYYCRNYYISIGVFYYSLGNLEPRLRSPTNAIQLVSVVCTEILSKYGVNTILKPFVDEVAKLESVRYI